MRCVICSWPKGIENENDKLHPCTLCGNKLQYDVSDIFEHGAAGLLKEKRQGQIDMANLIDDNLCVDGQLVMLLEGGTGVGKSYAYLIPPLLKFRGRVARMRNKYSTDTLTDLFLENNDEDEENKNTYNYFIKKKIYVSTTMIQLQERICDIDLNRELIPKLELAPEIRAIVMKGGKNYACLHPAAAANIRNKAYREEFKEFIEPYRENGYFADVKEVTKPIEPPWWNFIHLENCIEEDDKRRCPYHKCCRPNLDNSNVVIVNHMLMAILMARNLLTPKTHYGILDTLIVDEAHSFIGCLYAACTEDIKDNFLNYISSQIAKEPYITSMILPKKFDKLKKLFKAFFEACLNWKKASKADGGIMLPQKSTVWEELNILQVLYPAFTLLLAEITQELDVIAANVNPRNDVPSTDKKGIQEEKGINLERLAAYSRISKHVKRLKEVNKSLDAAMKTFGTGVINEKLPVINDDSISLVPTDIGEYAQRFLDGVPVSLFLSATLSVGEDFTYMKKQLGLDRPPLFSQRPTRVVEGVFESPFDYTGNGFSYTPLHVAQCPTYGSPPEAREAWYDSMAENIVFLTEKNKGDAFVLFTSRTEMETIYTRCLSNKPADSIVSYVLQEGKGLEAEKRYRNTDTAVLFGLKSFWEGIDIPGDKLRMVIITKLPFPILSDPIIAIESRKAKALNLQDFEEVQIPRMLMSLRQAAGRLIRTQDDKGVVVVLDSRIWTGGKHYRLKTMQKDSELKKPVNAESYGKEAMRVLNFKYRVDNKQMFVNLFNRLYAKDPRFVITG